MGARNANEKITFVKNLVLPGEKIWHFLSFSQEQHLSLSVKCLPTLAAASRLGGWPQGRLC